MTRTASARGVAAAVVLVGLAACSVDPGPPTAVGTLERDRVELIAEQQEPIVRIAVHEGDRVESGDAIVELDAQRTRAQLAAAQAAADESSARLAELLRGARTEEIEEARARLREAEGVLVRARPDLERARRLVATGVEPQSTLDRAEAALREAEGARDAWRATLERLLDGATVEELDQARARVAQGRAKLDEQRIRLDRLTVRAPAAGRVDSLPYEAGEWPPVGGIVAVLLIDDAPYARVYVPSALRTRATVGSAATVRVDGVDGTFAGRVRRVSAEASFTPYFALTERDRGRLVYVAEIDLAGDSARELATGLTVEATFDAAAVADGE